jgi:hypothetical protein
MFQNISAKRTNIKSQDLRYISCVAFHPYFVGIGHYSISGWGRYGYFGTMLLCYVKGVGENRAVMKWMVLNNYGATPPGRKWLIARSGHDYNFVTILNGDVGIEYDASYIHKDLKIRNGEVKMILDVMLWTDGSTKKANFWGFHIFAPKKDRTYGYFHSVVIFTPNPGLFSEDGME